MRNPCPVMAGSGGSGCLIQDTEISDNQSQDRGGGFYVDTNAACYIDQCDIHGRSTTEYVIE